MPRLHKSLYEPELARLQVEMSRLQRWVMDRGLKVVIVFEGRDAAGKGSTIKRIMAPLNPRHARVVALNKPTETERTQWYFQRYVQHMPAAGEMVLFDRSWYNRAGVERVMGFCTDDEYNEFLTSCPVFERMLVASGIILIKYWFAVSAEVQRKRLTERIDDPTRRWKIGPIDLAAQSRWEDYSRAEDVMMNHTDIEEAPWYVVPSNDKRRARLNCMEHITSLIPYGSLPEKELVLPPLQSGSGYVPDRSNTQNVVPQRW